MFRFLALTLRMLTVASAAAGLSACSTAPVSNIGNLYHIPDELWHVELVPAQHYNDPQIYVSIDQAFQWPVAPGTSDPVYYRVNVFYPDGSIKDAGRITTGERFALIWVLPDRIAAQLELTAEQDQQNITANRALLEQLLEQPPAETANGLKQQFEQLNAASPLRDIARDLEIREQALEYSIEILPFAGDRGLLRQEAPRRQPQRLRFTWGRAGQQLQAPCNNQMTPEACVRLRIQRFRDQICNARNAAGQPRFPAQCAKLTTMLNRAPSGFVAACTIPNSSGVSAGFHDPSTDTITLNGDNFLTGICPEATIWHELTHALDLAAGRNNAIRRLREAENRLKDADRRGARAIEDGNLVEARRQLRLYRQAELDIFELERTAGREMIETECRALFATIEQSDLFGYPGQVGLAWMKENISGMVGELANIRRMFNLAFGSPPVTGPLCTCSRRILAYVDDPAHNDIKANFQQQIIRPPPRRLTMYEMMNGLTRVYCGN